MAPREFFYDALHALASGRPMAPAIGEAASEWACPTCGEVVPANFEVCWNCQTPHSEAHEK